LKNNSLIVNKSKKFTINYFWKVCSVLCKEIEITNKYMWINNILGHSKQIQIIIWNKQNNK